MTDRALFGRGGRGAMHSRLVSVFNRCAGGERKESSGGKAGENQCFHHGIVAWIVTWWCRCFLLFGVRMNFRIDEGPGTMGPVVVALVIIGFMTRGRLRRDCWRTEPVKAGAPV